MSDWAPWIERDWLRYPVARCVHSNWAGSGYEFARENGCVVKFWTRKGAQAFADKLNASLTTSHGAGVSE